MSTTTTDETINLDVVDAATPGSFPPIPEGPYSVKVIETSPEPSKAGKPMYTLTFEVQSGEYRGRRLWHRRPVQATTAAFVKADLQALGLRVPSGQTKASDIARFVAREALGRLATLDVGFGKGEYADRNEVKAILPGDIEPASVEAFDESDI